MPSYSHFTLDERKMLYDLLNAGHGIRSAARELDRSPSSVSREIKRNHSLKPKNPSKNSFNYHYWRANIVANLRRSSAYRARYSEDCP